MPGLHDVAKMTVTGTPGTGTITLNAASSGYQTFSAAGVADQEVLSYRIDDGSSWEVGTGTYTASGTTLSRGVVFSSNSNALISASSSAIISIVALAPDYSRVLLSEVVTSGSQSSVTFSNIPQVYRDLEVRIRGRGDTVSTSVGIQMQFNGDTGNNYYSQLSWGVGTATTMGNAETIASGHAAITDMAAASAATNVSSMSKTVICDYRGTTFTKSWSANGGVAKANSSNNVFVEMASGFWNSTSAITSLKVLVASGNFVNNSVVSLYGHY